MEQLVILLIIGAISLIKWGLEKAAEAREQRKSAERFEKFERPADDETLHSPAAAPAGDDAARRLREALGLPEEQELPPPLPRKAPVILYERPLPEPLPPVDYAELEKRLFVPVEEEGPAAEPLVLSPAAPLVTEPEPRPPVRSGLDELLRNREGLRKAILVQEILGTPKGLVF